MKSTKRFSSRSLYQLELAHTDFQKILPIVLERSVLDFAIIESYRSDERQQYLYSIGRTINQHKSTVTNVDGVIRKSKHQSKPSLAVDLMIYSPDANFRKKIAWDEVHFAYLAGQIQIVAQDLFNKGEIKHLVRWGGNWDNDTVLSYDQRFQDLPHFELYKPK